MKYVLHALSFCWIGPVVFLIAYTYFVSTNIRSVSRDIGPDISLTYGLYKIYHHSISTYLPRQAFRIIDPVSEKPTRDSLEIRAAMRSFDVFVVVSPYKWLNKHLSCCKCTTPQHSCDVTVMLSWPSHWGNTFISTRAISVNDTRIIFETSLTSRHPIFVHVIKCFSKTFDKTSFLLF